MISSILHSQNFADDAARFILNLGRTAIAERGLFRLGLTGGRSPKAVNAAMLKLAGDFPWSKVQFTFGDERCVPPESEDSNFRTSDESLFQPAGIQPGNVFRLRGEIDPAEAAAEYEAKLAAVASRFGEEVYIHDLILLGLGEDGHVASLFPGSPGLEEASKLVIPNIGPKPPPQRLTMTFPLLNNARQILLLVPSADKREVAEAAIGGDARYPASQIHGQEQTTWLLGW